jgi:4Fe-4S dicluster protein
MPRWARSSSTGPRPPPPSSTRRTRRRSRTRRWWSWPGSRHGRRRKEDLRLHVRAVPRPAGPGDHRPEPDRYRLAPRRQARLHLHLRHQRVSGAGIDIRHGLQMECLACAQCADACDEVMLKIGRAPGLIRHASTNELEGRPHHLWRPRRFLYIGVARSPSAGWSLRSAAARRSRSRSCDSPACRGSSSPATYGTSWTCT